MSLAGLKKQLNKANQYLSEAIGGVEGTKLDEEFHELEKRSDLTARAIEQVVERVKEVLQPNPATRARMAAVSTFSTVSGAANQPKQRNYPQTEGLLGDAMSRFGRDMLTADTTSSLGDSLVEAGESFRQMAEVKYGLEAQVAQNFLDPLNQLAAKEIRDMYANRKKLEGRRLDWDCKKRKGGVPVEEMRQAEQKFEESKVLSENSMYQLLDNEVEQVSQLCELTSALVDYHRQSLEICEQLNERLKERRQKAAQKATQQHQRNVPRMPPSQSPQPPHHQNSQPYNGGLEPNAPPVHNYNAPNHQQQQQQQQQWNAQGANAPAPPYNQQQGSAGGFAGQQPPPPYAGQQQQQHQPQQQPPSSPSPHYPTLPRPQPGSQATTPSGAPGGFVQAAVADINNQQSNVNTNAPAPPSTTSSPTHHNAAAPPASPNVISGGGGGKPSARALFDFDAESPQELGFKENEIIELVRRVDENWFEGRTADGKQGLFPSNYIQVLVPVPE